MHCSTSDRPRFGFKDVSVNGQALSLFRIFFALLLLYDLFANVLPAWNFLYSGTGVLTAPERNSAQIWSLFTYTDNPCFARGVLCLYVLALLGFLAGWKTRLCSIIVLWVYASIVDRNLAANSNAEILAQGLLLWSCFLPLGRYWSFDAGYRDDQDRDGLWPFVPVLAMRVQIILVYLYSGLYKLADPVWLSGDAIRYAVTDRFYGTPLGDHILNLMPDTALHILTWGVILFQILFSLLIYAPIQRDLFRGIALAGAALMHIGFLLFLEVGIFPVLCLIYLLVLVPDRWIERLLRARRERMARIHIYYDPDCGFCRKISALFREFCLGPAAQVKSAAENEEALALLKSHNSWVVYGSEGKNYLKWQAVSYLLRRSPLFWIFGWIGDVKIFSRAFEKLYDAIGRRRSAIGAKTRFLLKATPETPPGLFARCFCLFCLCLLIAYSTLSMPRVDIEMPRKIRLAAYQFGVNQVWNIFAVSVTSWRWDMDITGYDTDGKNVYIRHIMQPHFRETGGNFYSFASHRVLKFYSRTFFESEEENRRGLVRYICTEAQKERLPLAGVRMVYGQARLHGDYRWERPASFYKCSDIFEASGL